MRDNEVRNIVRSVIKRAYYDDYLRKAAADKEEPEDYGLELLTGGSAAGLGGGALWAHKASKDIDRLTNRLSKWGINTHDLAVQAEATGRAEDALKALKSYTSGARQLLNTHIGGLPIPKRVMPFVGAIVAARNAIMKPESLEKKILNTIDQAKEGWRHYGYFTNKNIKPAERQAHLMVLALQRAGIHDMPQYVQNIMYSTKIMPEKKLIMLEKLNPQYADVFKKGLQFFVKHYIGGAQEFKYAPQYAETIVPVLRMLSDASKATRYGVGITAGGLLSSGILSAINKYRDKKASQIKSGAYEESDEGINPLWWAAPSVVGGGALMGGGIRKATKPLVVGGSWTELPGWGSGHKEPGKEGMKLLQRAADQEGISLTRRDLITDSKGRIPFGRRGTKYDVFLSTGGGGHKAWFPSPSNEFFKPTRDSVRVAPGGSILYMTDAIGPERVLDNTSVEGFSDIRKRESILDRLLRKVFKIDDTALTWGVNVPTAIEDNHNVLNNIKVEHTGIISPLLSREGIDEVSAKSKKDILKELAKQKMGDNSKRALANAAGKKIVVVAGSGRGDLVAGRVIELRNELLRQGLADKYVIVAPMAGGYASNPLRKVLEKFPNTVVTGPLPKNVYQSLGSIGDPYLGSSGSSSMLEALQGKSPAVLHPSIEQLKYTELKRLFKPIKPEVQEHLDSLAKILNSGKGSGDMWGEYDRLMREHAVPTKIWKDWKGTMTPYDLFKQIHLNLNVDSWNKFNKELFAMLPGNTMAQTPKEWVELLEKVGPAERDIAEGRAMAMRADAISSQEKAVDAFRRILRRAKRLRVGKGVGLAAVGAPVLGAGIYGINKALNRARKKEPSVIVPPDQVVDSSRRRKIQKVINEMYHNNLDALKRRLESIKALFSEQD